MSETKTYAQRVAEAERAMEMRDTLPWEEVTTSITREWVAAKDPVVRDDLWHDLQGLSRLRNRLSQVIQDGKVAAHEQAKANLPSQAQVRAQNKLDYANKLGIDLNG